MDVESGPDMVNAEQALMVKEAYAILIQGIMVVRYDPHLIKDKAKQILWLDPDLMRLCIAPERIVIPSSAISSYNTMATTTAPIIPYGLYLKDIAEIIPGITCYNFKANKLKPVSSDYCFSIVGSECCISVEFPSKFTRNWFILRFGCIINDILSPDERIERASWKLAIQREIVESELEEARHLVTVMKRGIQLVHHHKSGNTYNSLLTYDEENQTLIVTPTETRLFGLLTATNPTNMTIGHVAALRLGTHSFSFIKTNSTSKWRVCMSIIGSEGSLDLEFSNENARNIFAAKFRSFMYYIQTSSVVHANNEAQYGSLYDLV